MAIASECAAQQNAFWAFHDAYYEGASATDPIFGPGALERASDIAADLNLDDAAFRACLTHDGQSGEPIYERVRESHQDALRRGVDSTPTIMLNGKIIRGTPDEIMQAIAQAINDAPQAINDAPQPTSEDPE